MENNNTELIGFSKEKYQTAVANRDALKEQIKSLFGEDHVYDNAFEDDMAYKDTDIELMKNYLEDGKDEHNDGEKTREE